MKNLLVISSAPLIVKNGHYFGYAPYIREMDIWARHGKISFACPILDQDDGSLLASVDFPIDKIYPIRAFDLKSVKGMANGLVGLVPTVITLIKAMRTAGHIHLRCPGNISLIACFVQIFFPSKSKTAKYAGNWDPNAPQPWSYKWQRWLLANEFLTRNMRVLVYGKWPRQSRNVVPFFTATYYEGQKAEVAERNLVNPKLIFVGTLSPGKNPVYGLQLLKRIKDAGREATVDLYGDGMMRGELQRFIDENGLAGIATLHGNQPEKVVREAYQTAHFLILPSKSEGWPKVVAEAMFWGCMPVSTPVSCVPYMLDDGGRGILLTGDLSTDAGAILSEIDQPGSYQAKVKNGVVWSRQFTLDLFETRIKELLDEDRSDN